MLLTFTSFFLAAGQLVHAHVAAWHKGMYCLNGTDPNFSNSNADAAVQPLFNLTRAEWWFHHVNNCDMFPPVPGDFLELPAGGTFTVEHATNRGFTSLSFNGANTNEGLDGHPLPTFKTSLAGADMPCITQPNIHTQNESMASGTAFAISYESDIAKVTEENLVVFTVLFNTPWRRIATYSVPEALPACPEDGCTCAWGWVPNGCGEPNMYMQGFKCKVTGATSTTPLAPAQPPVWCEDNPSRCVRGAKQMIYWNQAEANNIEVSGNDLSGHPRSPAYNLKLGFSNGAQNDIFLSPTTVTATATVGTTSRLPTQTVPSQPSDTKSPTTPSPSQYNNACRSQISPVTLLWTSLFLSYLFL